MASMFLGFALSLGTALCKAASDITQKRATSAIAHDEIVILLQRIIEVAIACIALLVLVYGIDHSPTLTVPTITFLSTVALAATTNFVAFYCNVRALRLSDVSLVSPISQLTPAVLLVTSPLMLGETVSTGGVVGVLLVVCGAYIIGIKRAHLSVKALTDPLIHLASDRGVRYALLASALYGVSSNFDKIGVQMSDPFLFAITSGSMMALAIAVYSWVAHPTRLHITRAQAETGLFPGVTGGVGSLMQMYAISIWPVAYVISVKRLSSVFSVLSGALVFKEQHMGPRLVGAAIMVLGTATVLLFG